MVIQPRLPRVAATVAVAWLGCAPSPGLSVRAQSQPPTVRSVVAVWEPAYTGFVRLPGEDIAVTLATDGSGERLWLAGDTWVAGYSDGVWTPPEEPPDVSLIFALAATPDAIWAFGLDGGIWRRHAGGWRAAPPPVVADLYAATPDDAGAWAVGYDYAAEHGVVVRAVADASSPSATAFSAPWLAGRGLRSVGVDPRGRVWAGGCVEDGATGTRRAFLMVRDAAANGAGGWTPVAAPTADGCVYDLAFAGGAAGEGLAAAGGDLWRYDAAADDPGAAWVPFGQAPPTGAQWVRAVPTAGGTTPPEIASTYGWAIAGVPRWNGYADARTPWHFDDERWAEATVDPLGWAGGTPSAGGAWQPYLSLAADGDRAWTVGRARSDGAIADDRALLAEMAAGTVRLVHPRLAPGAEGDLAIGPTGAVFAGSSAGAAPFLRHDGAGWRVAHAPAFTGGARATVGRIDVAADGSAWALGTARPADGTPARRAAWRFDGADWQTADPPPADRLPAQLRALAGGGAWAVERDAGGSGRLWAYEGGAWRLVVTAPPLAPIPTAPSAAPAPLTLANLIALRMPADAHGSSTRHAGWLAGTPGSITRVTNGVFAPIGAAVRGYVTDVRMTGPRSGWAIATDPSRPVERTGPTTGVVLRLVDGAWREIPPRLEDAAGRPLGSAQGIVDAHWLLLAPVSADEAWLYGYLETERQGLRVLVGIGPGRGAVVLPCYGNVLALAAAPAGDGAGAAPGTDVWLMAEAPCGTPADPRLSPRLADGANPDYLPNHAGPIGRLRVRRVVADAFLPHVARDGAGD